jgi:hypothetical protein
MPGRHQPIPNNNFKLFCGHACVVAITSSARAGVPAAAMVFISFSIAALNGCWTFHSGCWGARHGHGQEQKVLENRTAVRARASRRCRRQRIRSCKGTKCGPPWVVTRRTKSSIDCLGRRVVDPLAIFVLVLFGLHHFGVNPTAALAGLSVGVPGLCGRRHERLTQGR